MPVEEMETWLREHLKDGPKPIVKFSLYSREATTRALANLGVQTIQDGPNGGHRWHLPTNGNGNGVSAPVTVSEAAPEPRSVEPEAEFLPDTESLDTQL